jgi:hypothetical protein
LSVFVRLLPYIEQNALYSKFNFGVEYGTAPNTTGTNNAFDGDPSISALLCPSNSSKTIIEGAATTNYVGIAGGTTTSAANHTTSGHADTYTVKPTATAEFTANLYAVAGSYLQNGALPFGVNRNFGSLSDGTSNIVVFGELSWAGAQDKGSSTTGPHVKTNWARGTEAATNNSSTTVVTSYNVKIVSSVDAIKGATSSAANQVINGGRASDAAKKALFQEASNVGSFGSNHTGTAIFGIGDGSVRGVSDTVDGVILERAANVSDGISVTF